MAQVTGARDARPLHISVTPTFAARWLMPRLAGFREEYPDIAVTVRKFVERDIAAGCLRVLHEAQAAGTGYHIVTRSDMLRAPLRTFVGWLQGEAAEP